MMALNAKLKRDGGSERHNWEEMVTLNAILWIMALNTKLWTNSSEFQTEKDDSERHN